MKPSKWTLETLKELTKDFRSPGAFKTAYPGAYKSMRQQGQIDLFFPSDRRLRHKTYTEGELRSIAALCKSRSEFQIKHPSAYNAARAANLIPDICQPSEKYKLFGRKPYTDKELSDKCAKYKTKKEFSDKENGAYQTACRRGMLRTFPDIQGTSAAELDLLKWLSEEVSADFKTKRFANDYELDCYSESLKIGIEYNGFYWHSEQNKGKGYHLKKTKYFEALGIRVIHVWEDEWRDRQDQVKSYLLSACGKNGLRIGARKCSFTAIEGSLAKEFLEAAHIQGAPVQVKLAIGCFYAGRLIGVATFGPHHRQNKETPVLNRFACLKGHTVSGGLAKMCKMASEQLGDLLSWADYSKSQAAGYLAAGWEVAYLLKPDYFYATSLGKRIGKQSRRKSAVGTPPEMTELAHATLDGLYRVWDCGKIALVYKAK